MLRKCPYIRPWERCSPDAAASQTGPAIDAETFLHVLGNRTLLLLGDSLQGQLFVAIACAMHGHVVASKIGWLPAGSVRTLSKRCGRQPHCHFFSGCVRFATGGQLCWTQAHQPVTLQGVRPWVVKEVAKYSHPAKPLILAYGTLAPTFTGGLAYEEFASAGRAEAEQLISAMSESRPQPVALWREMAAQHFAPRGGFFRGTLKDMDKTNVPTANESCVTHPSAEMERHNQWNVGSETPLRAAGVTLVRVWASTRDTFAAHVGRGDCTHFCQPGVPGQWAGMLADALGMAMSQIDSTKQFSSRSRRD